MSDYDIKIECVDHHRNGVGGMPFHVVTFRADVDSEKNVPFVATVFDYYEHKEATEYRNPYVAVLRRDLVGEGDIRFGYNSWRGDRYAPALYEAIDKHMAEQDAEWELKYPSKTA
jgi:hypothetical protein